MSHPGLYNDNGVSGYGSKFPITTLIARAGTLASLIVSVAVLKTNDVTLDNRYVVTYNDFRSYKYMFFVTLIGIGYTLLQIPFAMYYMRTKKHLINHLGFLKFEFYADKIMAFVLTTGAGAGFGATVDMKKYKYTSDDNKIQDFLTTSYVPAAFLLLGSFASGISSVHSSLALTKNVNN
ncbi:hypothetical protein CDL12_23106 [Handroanthus impetiginosus]|uniref:CASP-like protein n=1 Tax=Handroanthus impetiginosus TaxID=429701 RepID=A0A2G9FWF4_9LAMI|nr:hypothetical protein CDL12_30142 [Handroanthus impetiginosus]PIN04357.1 hypothetical protein CDL12_23106 [Handroanthus impetiginosus]